MVKHSFLYSEGVETSMQTMLMRTFLILTVLIFFNPFLLQAAMERRTALVIGNSSYSSSPLQNPVNDATDMATMLEKLGFDVILKKNVTHRSMEEAIRDFGNRLKKRKGVGLFFYAGHGLQTNNMNYLIPIGARIEKETDVQFEAVNAERILAEMASADNGLNIVILDACRDNPFRSHFRSSNRGLAVVSNAPAGTLISYSTAANQVARDGSGRNSPYTAALLKQIGEPGLSINDVFMKVRQNVRKSTGQTPWELSSLEGNFYFNQGQTVKRAEKETEPGTAGKDEGATAGLETEQQKKALAEEKQKLEETKKQLAAAQRPFVPKANEIKRDGRFVAYDDGTVLDTKLNLMWAGKDNGNNINWADAKSYCENYRGGGYADWRMPTQDELTALYDAGKSRRAACNRWLPVYVATELIDITCYAPWASETRGSGAALFNFGLGNKYWHHQSNDISESRALPVRLAR